MIPCFCDSAGQATVKLPGRGQSPWEIGVIPLRGQEILGSIKGSLVLEWDKVLVVDLCFREAQGRTKDLMRGDGDEGRDGKSPYGAFCPLRSCLE